MESLQEFIPFAKEMLSQKSSCGLLKVYLLGSVFAVLGTIIGVVETLCYPLCSAEPVDAEMVVMLKQKRTVRHGVGGQDEEEEGKEELAHENGATTQSLNLCKTHRLSRRSSATRLHAS